MGKIVTEKKEKEKGKKEEKEKKEEEKSASESSTRISEILNKYTFEYIEGAEYSIQTTINAMEHFSKTKPGELTDIEFNEFVEYWKKCGLKSIEEKT